MFGCDDTFVGAAPHLEMVLTRSKPELSLRSSSQNKLIMTRLIAARYITTVWPGRRDADHNSLSIHSQYVLVTGYNFTTATHGQ